VIAKLRIDLHQPTVQFINCFIQIWHDNSNSHLSFLRYVRYVLFEHALYAVIGHRKQETELPPKLMWKTVCSLPRLNIGFVRRWPRNATRSTSLWASF